MLGAVAQRRGEKRTQSQLETQGKVSIEKLQCCWEGNINTTLKETERKNVEWNKIQWLNFVKAIMKSW